MRQAAGDDAISEALACCHTNAPLIEECALAAFGGEKLVQNRVVDDACDDVGVAFECDRDRELRDAVQKIGGAVERVDDPAFPRRGGRRR
jgi:hypothetical protein